MKFMNYITAVLLLRLLNTAIENGQILKSNLD